jgi:biopolymer transport protein ExbD
MKFTRKPGMPAVIPSASMSDIIFTLLLFFMTVTVLKKYEGLKVNIPEAWKTEKLMSKTHTSFLWLNDQEQLIFDDVTISNLDEISVIAREKIEQDVQLIIFLRVDRYTKMGMLNDVQVQLRNAGALRVIYATSSKASANY